MKLPATTANASITAHTHKAISQQSGKSTATGKTFWQSLAVRFWAYTEATGTTETKSFEGLL